MSNNELKANRRYKDSIFRMLFKEKAEFLMKNRAEVQRMSVLEYNEELHIKNVHQDGYDEGHDDGYSEGHGLGLDEGISGAVALLRSMGLEDSVILQKICEQYNLKEVDAKKYL